MSQKIHIELGDIQKTLLLPLWARAVETQKSKPLLFDPAAAEILGKIDYNFLESTKHFIAISQLGWIARTIHIDTFISQLIGRNPASTIVNIGCGLDTTFDRIDNGLITWYDIDLPVVIALRKKLISESERRITIPTSFLDHDWLNYLKTQEEVLFIAAGVFYYFEEQQIKDFLIYLADVILKGEILFDASSPLGIRMANYMVIKASGMDEKSFLKWGLKKAATLESWNTRIKIVDEYPMFKTIMKRLQFKDKFVAWIFDKFKMLYILVS